MSSDAAVSNVMKNWIPLLKDWVQEKSSSNKRIYNGEGKCNCADKDCVMSSFIRETISLFFFFSSFNLLLIPPPIYYALYHFVDI